MKKLTLQLAIVFCATSLFAQWIPVNNGLPDFPPTSLTSWVDTMVVGTYGGGMFLTYDQGENWSEFPGTPPNLYINKIDYGGGQFDAIGVASDGGPFICINGGYIDCNGTGLTNNAINWWSPANGVLSADYFAGTKGDGIFAADYTSPFIYDWYQDNPGLSGDALYVNDGLVGVDLALLATDGGFFKAVDDDTEWTAKNTGLSGDALKINSIAYLGYVIFANTDGGLYYTQDFGENWTALFTDEIFKVAFLHSTDLSPEGYMFFAFGESGYSTEDFVTWTEMDFGGIDGVVTAAAADSTNLYIGFTTDEKGEKESGGMYRRPVEDFLVGVENHTSLASKALLEQNYPNPFTNTTQISYSLSQPGLVSLILYDMVGTVVQSVFEKQQRIGKYTHLFNAGDLAPGIYYYSLKLDNQVIETKKMILIK